MLSIFKDYDVAAGQRLHAFVGPVPASYRGGAVPERGDAVGILFALRHEHGGIGKFKQIGQAIENSAIAGIPGPTTVAIGPTLEEALRLVPHHLVKQNAALVRVIVGRDNARRGAALEREEVPFSLPFAPRCLGPPDLNDCLLPLHLGSNGARPTLSRT